MLLEPEPGFPLIKRLGDNFGRAFGIVHVLVVIRNVLSLLEHKFG